MKRLFPNHKCVPVVFIVCGTLIFIAILLIKTDYRATAISEYGNKITANGDLVWFRFQDSEYACFKDTHYVVMSQKSQKPLTKLCMNSRISSFLFGLFAPDHIYSFEQDPAYQFLASDYSDMSIWYPLFYRTDISIPKLSKTNVSEIVFKNNITGTVLRTTTSESEIDYWLTQFSTGVINDGLQNQYKDPKKDVAVCARFKDSLLGYQLGIVQDAASPR